MFLLDNSTNLKEAFEGKIKNHQKRNGEVLPEHQADAIGTQRPLPVLTFNILKIQDLKKGVVSIWLCGTVKLVTCKSYQL